MLSLRCITGKLRTHPVWSDHKKKHYFRSALMWIVFVAQLSGFVTGLALLAGSYEWTMDALGYGSCKIPRYVTGKELEDRATCLSNKVSQRIGCSLVRTHVQQHIAFLKVHKAASSTLQNIFYRYGVTRDLSLLLPSDKEELRFSVRRGEHKKVIPPYKGEKYDIMANHAVFDEKIFAHFLHEDTTYIAVVREPTKQFVSAVLYFRYRWPNKYLTDIPEDKLFPLLIRYPEKYEPKDLRWTYTYNFQANDFGLTLDRVMRINASIVTNYLQKMNNIFHLVLLADYFDDSLVLMKRYLNWELKDILYITVNAFDKVPKPNLTDEDIRILRERNYLDYTFYDFFQKRFWTQMGCESCDIHDEILHFKRVKAPMTSYCSQQNFKDPFIVSESKWNKQFNVTKEDCDYMMTEEMDFFTKLQIKQSAKRMDSA